MNGELLLVAVLSSVVVGMITYTGLIRPVWEHCERRSLPGYGWWKKDEPDLEAIVQYYCAQVERWGIVKWLDNEENTLFTNEFTVISGYLSYFVTSLKPGAIHNDEWITQYSNDYYYLTDKCSRIALIKRFVQEIQSKHYENVRGHNEWLAQERSRLGCQ